MTQPFIAKRQVEFRDTDAAGIMHFSTFITYMEESEHELLRSVGLSVMNCEVDGIHLSWPRVSVNCDFTRPLSFEDEFEIHVLVAKLGGKSATYSFEFVKDDQTLATGSITAVCCTMADGKLKSTPIPHSVREKLSTYLKS